MMINHLYYIGDEDCYTSLEEALSDLAYNFPLEENIDTAIEVYNTKQLSFVDMFNKVNLENDILSFLNHVFGDNIPDKFIQGLILDKDVKEKLAITLGQALDHAYKSGGYFYPTTLKEIVFVTKEMIGEYYE